MDSPFGILSVLFLTILFIVIALFGYYMLLKKFKLKIYQTRIIAIIIVVLTLGLPFSIPQAPLIMIIFLLLMHIATGIIVIMGLTTDYLWVYLE